jgi:hypothetical protein
VAALIVMTIKKYVEYACGGAGDDIVFDIR